MKRKMGRKVDCAACRKLSNKLTRMIYKAGGRFDEGLVDSVTKPFYS